MSVLLTLPHPFRRSVKPLRVDSFGLTDVGRVREHNEDCFAVLPHLGLFVVADGMGGRNGGEIASRMVVDTLQEAFEDEPMPRSERCLSRLMEAIEVANACIFAAGQQDRTERGMGTTVVSAALRGAHLTLAHVGDSRAYRLRDGRLDLLTEDHSLVNDYIRAGVVNPRDAMSHPLRHIITRSVGTSATVDVETRTVAVEPGDVYLLCSDGLNALVGHREIGTILRENDDLRGAASALIEGANSRGGFDNVTAVLLRIAAPAG
jgi:protein phosphatase